MPNKWARILWMIAVALYVAALVIRLASRDPLRPGDAIGPIALAIIGWSVFRKPKA